MTNEMTTNSEFSKSEDLRCEEIDKGTSSECKYLNQVDKGEPVGLPGGERQNDGGSNIVLSGTDRTNCRITKFDFVQTKVCPDKAEIFDRQWPTSIEEARRREQELQELKTVCSSSSSASSQDSMDSVNVTVRKTPKAEVRSVKIETVQAKRILVKSLSNPDDQNAPRPDEEETTPLDNIESIPSDHSLESKAPKKRSRFRKMIRAIGKCFSGWCYPAVATISYGESYTLAQ